MARKRHSFFILPVIIAVFSVAGGLYGPRVAVASAATDADSSERILNQEVDGFAKVYSLVEQNFADPMNADKAIYRGAIPGMLRTLDPHSNFFDPKDYQAIMEEQKGTYYGVGMTVSARNG